jgi:hypothetical protein
MAEIPHDLVFSYTVHRRCKTPKFFEPIQEALEKGYRIVDVIPCAASIRSDRDVGGDVVVTVVLTRDRGGLAYHCNLM